MISNYREQFNHEFSVQKYQEIIEEIENESPLGFRLAESPVFLTSQLHDQLIDACNTIIQQIKDIPSEELNKAVPAHLNVPNDTAKPHFLAIDFGLCENEQGEISPKLIELQAFPSLYAFKKDYEQILRKHYPILNDFPTSSRYEDYQEAFKKLVLADAKPEEVILLELYPEKQKTAIDFYATEQMIGIKTVCITQIQKEGRTLFYDNNGQKTQIKRIYNRVIFDELYQHSDLKLNFNFTDDLDITWVTHPNWFFKVSKYLLPKLKHDSVPKSYFLNEFPKEEPLENYVLKPLFSFAGAGVDLHPTEEKIAEIQDKENYILQRKVTYAPLFKDINGEFSKAEIRMLYIWDEADENPKYMINLVRMTKVAMVNVNFNKKDAIWIGSSLAFFEQK